MTPEEKEHLRCIWQSSEKESYLFILQKRLTELRDELEDVSPIEATSRIRGGILEIRSLIDLIESISSQDD